MINKRENHFKIISEKGITLTSIMITVVLMLIIAGITISFSSTPINETRLKGFYSELEIIQRRVDSIAVTNEKYIKPNGDIISIKETGSSLTQSQQNFIRSISSDLNVSKFRFFTKEELFEHLDLYNMNYNVFINFDDRIIIAEEGVTVDGITYYMLENTLNYINQNTQKNVGQVNFEAVVTEYGAGEYKIAIIPEDEIGDLQEGYTIKYKKENSNYWETTNNSYFIADELTTYEVIYEDINGNTKTRTLVITEDTNDEYTAIDKEEFEQIQVTFTIVPIPSDAEVIINGESRTNITVNAGSSVNWSVSKTGYVTQNGSKNAGIADEIIQINLQEDERQEEVEFVTFTITPTPSDAVVTINGEQRTSIEAEAGSSLNWTVSKTGYVTKSDTQTMGESDITLPVSLSRNQVTFTITPSPSDAAVTINGETRTSITVDAGSNINWSVSKPGYVTQSDTQTMGENDITLPVSLNKKQVTFTINPTPSNATVEMIGELNGRTITKSGTGTTSINVDAGTTIVYETSATYYETLTSEYIIGDSNYVLTLSLNKKQVTFTINPTPNDATVKINGITGKSLTVDAGSEISWIVNRNTYYDKSGTYTMQESDYSESVTLSRKPTQSITKTPSSISSSGSFASTAKANTAKKGADDETGSYARGSGSSSLIWNFNFSEIDSNAEIVKIYCEYRVAATTDMTTYTYCSAGGTRFYSEKNNALFVNLVTGSNKNTATITTNLPTAAQVKNSFTLQSTKGSSSGWFRWYGATVTISYINP